MTTATLAYHRIQKNIQSQIRGVALPRINLKLSLYLLIGLMSVLLLYYVWQINELTRGSYTMNTYSKQINTLMSENKDLEVNLAESSFMPESLAKIDALNFQKATSVKYLQILDTSLASAKTKPAN